MYDTLGFISPVILGGKSFLQELCWTGDDWADPLPENLESQWNEWKPSLSFLSGVKNEILTGYDNQRLKDGASLFFWCCSNWLLAMLICISTISPVKVESRTCKANNHTKTKWRIYASVNSPSSVKIMACRLVGAKPFSEPMMEYCWFDP